MVILLSLLLASLAALSTEGPSQAFPQAIQTDLHRPQWLPRQEDRDWLEALANADIASMHDRRCVCALLRGNPEQGDPTDLYLELAQADTRPHSTCVELTTASRDILNEPGSTPEKQRILERVALACEPSGRLLGRLTRFPEHCPPFQVGLPHGRKFRGLDAILVGLGFRVRFLKETGAIQEALDLALDLAAFSQNMGRGWASLHQAVMAADQWFEGGQVHLAELLDTRALKTSQLRQLVRESSILLRNEPGLGRLLVADQTQFVYNTVLASYFGPDWSPRQNDEPPAKGRLQPGKPKRPPGGVSFQPSETLFFFLAMRLKTAEVLDACGAGASLQRCLATLNRLTEVELEIALEPSLWKRLRRALETSGFPRGLFLSLSVAGNPPKGAPMEALVAHLLTRRAALALLRLQAAVQLHEEQFGGPPTESTLKSPPWMAILEDPIFGGLYELTISGASASVIPPALPLRLSEEDAARFTKAFAVKGIPVNGVTDLGLEEAGVSP